MIKEISKITGLALDESNPIAMDKLRRIAQKFPLVNNFVVSLDNMQFVRMVKEAAAMVEAEGDAPLTALVADMAAPAAEKKLKIKSSPKGVRIKVAAANGVRFSFGPIWNASVTKGKGIATAEANREKLNHQALLAGIKAPEKLDIKDLCSKIAATF
jgi:hypothetical protein